MNLLKSLLPVFKTKPFLKCLRLTSDLSSHSALDWLLGPQLYCFPLKGRQDFYISPLTQLCKVTGSPRGGGNEAACSQDTEGEGDWLVYTGE